MTTRQRLRDEHPVDESYRDNDDAEAEEVSTLESLRILLRASRAFWLVNQVNFLDGIAYFGVLTLLTLFISQYVGVSDQATGVYVSAFTGAVTLFMFFGGFISDWLGVRKAITVCLLVLLAGRLLLLGSLSLGLPALVLSLLIMALGTGVLQPALYAGVKEFTDERSSTIAYSLLYAIMNLGILAENFVSPYIREHRALFQSWLGLPFLGDRPGVEEAAQGIPAVYLLLALVTLLMLGVHLFFFTKKVEEDDYHAPKTPAAPEEGTWIERLKRLPFLDARFQFFIFILLPVRTLFAHQFLTLPDYVMKCFPEEVGARYEWFQGLNPLIIVFAVPLIAAFTRKVNVVTMMIIGTTISALTTFILVPGPDLTRLLLYVILFSLGEAVWSSRFMEFVADLAPAGKVGAYMGLAGIPWFLAKSTTGLYSGFMIERFLPGDSGTMWLIYAGIACVSPVGLILGRRWVLAGLPNKPEPGLEKMLTVATAR